MGTRFEGPRMARFLSLLFPLLLVQSSLACSAASERSRRAVTLPDHGLRSVLHRDLMEGYERDVIPMEAAPSVDSSVNAVIFNLGASVIRLDMDGVDVANNEQKPVLKMTSWLRMSWMDFRLKWNPEAYGGITNIRLPASKVWLPDVEVFDAVTFGPNSKDYSCHMKIGSWTYDAFHLDLSPFDNMQRESPYLVTSQDGDAKVTKYYDCCKEPYMNMDYKFTVRKSTALPAPVDDYFASYKNGSVLVSDPKTTKLRGY